MTNQTYDRQLFSEFFGSQAHAFVWLEPVWDETSQTIVDFIYTYGNDIGLNYFHLPPLHLHDIRISNTPSLTDAMRSGILNEMIKVYETGITSETNVYNPIINRHAKVFRIKFRSGVLTVVQDNTEEIRAIHQLNEKTKELEHQKAVTDRILDASLSGVFVAQAVRDNQGNVCDFLIQRTNPAFTRMLNLSAERVVGKSFLSIFPSAKEKGIFDLHCRVYKTGIAESIETRYYDSNINAWFLISSVKLDDGVLITFNDITQNKQSLEHIQEQKTLLDNILENSSNGISVSKVIRDDEGKVVDARTILANDAAIFHAGIPRDIYLSKTATQLDPNILNSPYYQMCLNTLETGKSSHIEYFYEPRGRWLEVSISRMDKDHLITIFTDVTSTKKAQLAKERSASQLQIIINKTQSGIFTVTPVWDENNNITDFRFVIVNRALAAYKNVEPETLVGQLGSTWFSGYKANGLFDLFLDTYETAKINRFDFHYDADGIDAWIDMMCTRVEDEILVTFTDYTPVKQLQLELEKSVQELRLSNTNLEEFAYIASHDLQEPLRKIQTFSDRLKKDLSSALTPENRNIFDRMNAATIRMRTLIEDVLSYSKVSAKTGGFQPVELNGIVQQVLQDLEATVTETNAIVTVESLPVIKGDESQLRQLFQNILGNALKYRKPGTPPKISVTCRTIDETDPIFTTSSRYKKGNYYLLEVTDNGIGFGQEYAEKIFQVFQRLHGRAEYPGTGVGLAIVDKVVANHGGYISAQSEPGLGAKFQILLPEQREQWLF